MENVEYEQKDLTQCPNCSRKFLKDRLEIHLRACKAAPKKGSLTTSMDSNTLFLEKLEKQMKSEGGGDSKKDSESETGKGSGTNNTKPNRPMTLVCYLCGKEFGTQSLGIHFKTCETNFLRDHQSLPEKPPTLDIVLSKKNLDYEELCQY